MAKGKASNEGFPEIILIDKSKGITSFDVIRRLRRQIKESDPENPLPKIGHAGTLDPMATGLLIVGIGKGTKRLNGYLKLPKVYRAEILLGVRTDTGDVTGKIVEEGDVTSISQKEVEKVLEEMEGVLELTVPVYSAVKKDGQPLYKRARRGESVTPPIKKMEIKKAKLLGCSSDGKHYLVAVLFDVGSGTYIRSLAEEVGRRLGYPATLKELRRTQAGEHRVEDAVSL